MENLQEHLTTLENVLVREFRACQTLHSLTKEERLVLSSGDISGLLNLVEQKEAVLDEMSQLEDKRRMVVPELAEIVGLQTQSPNLSDVLKELDNDLSDRLARLREGITALLGGIRNLTFGNRALATAGLERVDAVQAFLLDLLQPLANYSPQGIPQSQEPPLALDIDHRA